MVADVTVEHIAIDVDLLVIVVGVYELTFVPDNCQVDIVFDPY